MAQSNTIDNNGASGERPAGPPVARHALGLAVNEALGNIQNQLLRARARGGVNISHGADQKRTCSAWIEYGWPEDVSEHNLYWLYRRDGVAFGVIEKLLGRCWSDMPEVIEGEKKENSKRKTPWEKANTALLSSAWLWEGFKCADRRRLVTRWSALILHIADNGKWNQPVRKTSAGNRLDKITPVWSTALRVSEWDTDENSPTYGEPLMWQYTEAKSNGFQGKVRDIHPDRIFILGDPSDDAIGFLEPVYNAFVSLEKVAGGSGESFLKNAARQIAVNYDKGIDFAAMAKRYGVPQEQLHAEVQKAARDLNAGNDVLMVTQGADMVTPLVSQVADPAPTFAVNLQIVAAGVDIPSKIIIGNQTGERASTEDDAYMNKRCQGRRDSEMAPEVLDFVRKLMSVSVVTPTNKMLTVIWGDLTLPTQTERLANAKTMGEINTASLGTSGETFSRGEVREAAGYEPDTAPDTPTPLPENDVDDDETETAS